MANLDEYKTVIGEAFKKGVGRGEIIEGDADKVNFTVKSDRNDAYINCTLWKSSHGHIEIHQGDGVRANGKVTKRKKDQGEGFWVNLSIKSICVFPMDPGVDDRDSNNESAAGDDEPDVL